MKLYGSLTSPFVRKARVVVAEKALACDFVRDNPRLLDSHAQRLNPLGKVPVLELDDGQVLYDSPVIIEYLDTLGPGALLPAVSAARWSVLRLQALADGLLESTVRVWLEERRAPEERRADFRDWEIRRIERTLAGLEAEAPSGPCWLSELSVADIAVGVALEYVNLRLSAAFCQRYPRLVTWLAPISRRPSFLRTALADLP